MFNTIIVLFYYIIRFLCIDDSSITLYHINLQTNIKRSVYLYLGVKFYSYIAAVLDRYVAYRARPCAICVAKKIVYLYCKFSKYICTTLLWRYYVMVKTTNKENNYEDRSHWLPGNRYRYKGAIKQHCVPCSPCRLTKKVWEPLRI